MSQRSSSRLQTAVQWLENYWAEISSLLGSIFLALSGILASVAQGQKWSWVTSTAHGWFFILGSLLSLAGGIVSIRRLSVYKRQGEENVILKRELVSRKQGFSKILRDELRVLSQILKFNNSERISLYKHDSREKTFLMIARYSANPKFKNTGRGKYPDNQGCIGKAWDSEFSFVDDLPDPITQSHSYYQILETKWSIDRQTANLITMKSRTYAAYSIKDIHEERIAVIVFESLNPKYFKAKMIQDTMNGGEEKRIRLLLQNIGDITPDPVYALQEDF